MMLQPGCRVVVAPHFHLQADWPRRLRIGGGVVETDQGFIPQPPWRTPAHDELLLLSADTVPQADLEDCICLFHLPRHLLSEWWRLLEQGAATLGSAPLPGFDTFVNQVSAFLAFKSIPLPEFARGDVVVSAAGQPFMHWGLRCSLLPHAQWPSPSPPNGSPGLWGVINLGDEETSLVLINLNLQQMAAELHRRSPDQPAPATVGELTRRFLQSCADYPPVRLILGAGEGCRAPRGGLVVGRDSTSSQDPDVLLLISNEGRPDA